MSVKTYQELIGIKFSKLTVLEINRNINNHTRVFALCKCECGIQIVVRIDSLKNGNTQSCGCLKIDSREKVKTHGLTNHPLYRIWAGIKNRCQNKKYSKYHLYGGKGVRVCEEWLRDPSDFIAWALKNGWVKGKQIDKDIIPRKLGIPALLYSPQMCSIVSNRENSNNRDISVILTYQEEALSLTVWAEKLNIHPATIQSRLKRNWPIHEVLNVNSFTYRTKKQTRS